MKRGILGVFIVILLSRIALGIYLFLDSGSFFMLTGDDVVRTQLAYNFFKKPVFSPHELWLPLPFWIMGLALRLYSDLLIIPAIVNTLFTIATIILIYYLTQTLFNRNHVVSLSCAAVISFIPWLVWLSISGLSESIYHFFVLLGILFWVLYVKNQKRSMHLISSLGFAFCTMVRFEGWPLLCLFTLFSIKNVLIKKDKLDCPFIITVSLGWIFISCFLLDQYIRFGNPLNFFHLTNLVVMVGGWSTPPTFFGKFLYYPLELLRFSLPTIILSFVGLLTSWASTKKYIGLVLFQLLALSLMASLSGVATNTPIRIIFTTYIQLIPLASYGLYSVLKLLRKTWLINLSLAVLILLICSSNISGSSRKSVGHFIPL